MKEQKNTAASEKSNVCIIRRCLLLLLLLSILCGTIGVLCYAEDENQGVWKKNIYWSYDEFSQTLSIFGNGEMQEGDYPWHKYSSKAKSLIVEEGITSLASYAFSRFSEITSESLVLPDSLTSIGNGAFHICEKLTSFHIPRSVNDIGVYALAGCSMLEEITVAPENRAFCAVDGCLYTKDQTELVCYPMNKTDKQFNIPATVDLIRQGAFSENSHVETVTMSKVKTIDAWAFGDCTSLSVCSLCESLEVISLHAFENCTSLKDVTVFGNIKQIYYGAFNGCSLLDKITLLSAERLIAKVNTDIITIDLSDPYAVASYLKDDRSCSIVLNKCTVEFYSEGRLVQRIDYVKGDAVAAPSVPSKEGYEGKWEKYTLSGSEPVTKVNAVYTCLHPEKYVSVTSEIASTEESEGYTAGKFCSQCQSYIEGHTVIPKKERTLFRIEFYVGNTLLEGIDYYQNDKITVPSVPSKEGYIGKWGNYTLSTEPLIKVSAEYECMHPDSYVETAKRIEPGEETEGRTEGKYCAQCGKILSGCDPIPAIGVVPHDDPSDQSYRTALIIVIAVIAILAVAVVVAYVLIRRSRQKNKKNCKNAARNSKNSASGSEKVAGSRAKKAVVNKTAKSISNSAPKATDITDDMDKEMKLRTVGIQIGSKSGKGLVVQSEVDKLYKLYKLYILTCSHVCEGYDKADKGTVSLYAANNKCTNKIQISEIECSEHSDDIDLALVIVRNEVIPVEYKNLRQLNFAEGKKRKTIYAQIWDDSFLEHTKKKCKIENVAKDGSFFSAGIQMGLSDGDSGTPVYTKGNIVGMFRGKSKNTDLFIMGDSLQQTYYSLVESYEEKRKDKRDEKQ